MPRPRKSIQQLQLSGTYGQNKKRYADRLVADQGMQSMQPVRFRAPKHFNTVERDAHREIMAMCPGLTEADKLLVEMAAVLLARQRSGAAKTSELNKLTGLLERLRGRAATVPATVAPALSSSAIRTSSGEFVNVNFDAYPDGLIVTGGAEFGGYWDRDEIRKKLMAEGRMTAEQYENEFLLELAEI